MPRPTDGGPVATRDEKAASEYMTVLADLPRVANATDLYVVIGQSGNGYLVDARQGVCECPDSYYRDARCKHVRRVEFATGERALPRGLDTESVDPQLGQHVDGVVCAEPATAITDGGNDDRPADCECGAISTDVGEPLCCLPCYLAGYETPPTETDTHE